MFSHLVLVHFFDSTFALLVLRRGSFPEDKQALPFISASQVDHLEGQHTFSDT